MDAVSEGGSEAASGSELGSLGGVALLQPATAVIRSVSKITPIYLPHSNGLLLRPFIVCVPALCVNIPEV